MNDQEEREFSEVARGLDEMAYFMTLMPMQRKCLHRGAAIIRRLTAQHAEMRDLLERIASLGGTGGSHYAQREARALLDRTNAP